MCLMQRRARQSRSGPIAEATLDPLLSDINRLFIAPITSIMYVVALASLSQEDSPHKMHHALDLLGADCT